MPVSETTELKPPVVWGRPIGASVAFGVPHGSRWDDERLARLLFEAGGHNLPPRCSVLPFAEQPEAIRAVFLKEAARLNQLWWGDTT